MGEDFFTYIELLEMLTFFSGYPLVYLLVKTLTGSIQVQKFLRLDLAKLLPFAYALTGVLFVGLQLKNLYPDYSIEHLGINIQLPYLKLWALLSLLFFVPFFNRKPLISLLHSLVFFYFVVADIVKGIALTSQVHIIKNIMNIYTYSLLINLAAFLLVLVSALLYNKVRNR